MSLRDSFIFELESEVKSTRKILERIPIDKSDWKPHEKSTNIGQLAFHVAEIPGWVSYIIDGDELDFAKMNYKPRVAKNTDELLNELDKNYNSAINSLRNSKEEDLQKNWTLRTGDNVHFTLPKSTVLRSFSYNHWYHHRAQLTVYLRLLDVPLPNIYGPTADEK